ncbi:SoxR reducing system RseC family protein [Winogradskyella sp. A2]|uniref:SoxR reducing system RseC family protein n=1 Tax=Winogradskyella sp. A2 TaxID=3366944 RepID=UPI00398C5BC7
MNSLLKNRNTFVHAGIISKINSDSVVITLEQNIQCESCQVKGSCGLSELSTKKVEAHDLENSFRINEKVLVTLKKITGLKAVFWAYVFPFILMVFTLVITSSLLKEWLAGLLALFVLIPYYALLYFLKNKLIATFKISVLKT